MLCFRRSFKLRRDEKFYITIIFKHIATESLRDLQILQDVLQILSEEVVYVRTDEIANDFGQFLVLFQDCIKIRADGKLQISTFQLIEESDEIRDYICDVFRLKPFSTHSTFMWNARIYNTISTLKLDDVELFRTRSKNRWDCFFYLAGLPNLGPRDFNCNF